MVKNGMATRQELLKNISMIETEITAVSGEISRLNARLCELYRSRDPLIVATRHTDRCENCNRWRVADCPYGVRRFQYKLHPCVKQTDRNGCEDFEDIVDKPGVT
jgi:hypothetical protein